MASQHKVSVKSNWDTLNTQQQEQLKLKAKGQLKGEIGFFDSEKAILEKRMTFYDKFESQISHADNLHKLPTETLTLIDKDTILPMTEVDGKLGNDFCCFKIFI